MEQFLKTSRILKRLCQCTWTKAKHQKVVYLRVVVFSRHWDFLRNLVMERWNLKNKTLEESRRRKVTSETDTTTENTEKILRWNEFLDVCRSWFNVVCFCRKSSEREVQKSEIGISERFRLIVYALEYRFWTTFKAFASPSSVMKCSLIVLPEYFLFCWVHIPAGSFF